MLVVGFLFVADKIQCIYCLELTEDMLVKIVQSIIIIYHCVLFKEFLSLGVFFFNPAGLSIREITQGGGGKVGYIVRFLHIPAMFCPLVPPCDV